MNKKNQLENKKHRTSSNFVRELVQQPEKHSVSYSLKNQKPPKKIIQYWDNLDRLPSDVNDCLETWNKIEEIGFERLLFDDRRAKAFILERLGLRYKIAYEKCYHPAMQSDYFRLCYILVEGGCYIDTDDIYSSSKILHFFSDGRLKIQPLCYDKETNSMVSPSLFTKLGADSPGWIFYFNNNPLIAGAKHPLIKRALVQATLSIETCKLNDMLEIQSTTGPGNLTKSIFEAATENEKITESLLVLCDWDNIVKNKWDLSYRNDSRNWRLSNGQLYK